MQNEELLFYFRPFLKIAVFSRIGYVEHGLIKSISCFIIKIGFAFLELFRRRRRRIRQAIYKEWTSITSVIHSVNWGATLASMLKWPTIVCGKIPMRARWFVNVHGVHIAVRNGGAFADEGPVSRAWKFEMLSCYTFQLLPACVSWYITSFVGNNIARSSRCGLMQSRV